MGKKTKHILKIPSKIQLGTQTYKICKNKKSDTLLEEHNFIGLHMCGSEGRKIFVHSQLTGALLTNVFVHELVHACDNVFNGLQLDESCVAGIAEGLTCIFQTYGIEFEEKNGKTKRLKPKTRTRKVGS